MKTVISYTFDDSVYGHEIKDEWMYSMVDAACYCHNRAIGMSPTQAHQVKLDEEARFMAEMW